MSEIGSRILAEAVAKYGPPPESFTFGDGIDWESPLADTSLHVELPFWLMMPSGTVTVEWEAVSFPVRVCERWMEVFVGEVTDSRMSVAHQGPLRPNYDPPPDTLQWLEDNNLSPRMGRETKTVIRLDTRAHESAFRTITEDKPPRARREQEAYWASLCEAHIPVLNELVQRYRLGTYDYFPYEVSAWDVPIWYLKHAGSGYRVSLLIYKDWDEKPVTIEDGAQPQDPPVVRPFQFTTPDELTAGSSAAATPGEFELLDARSLMERGDYTGAVRRTVTAIEAVLEWALRTELLKTHSPSDAQDELDRTRNNFKKRRNRWLRSLDQPDLARRMFERFEATRDTRHAIVHQGRRITLEDRGSAQRMVDTGRWLYNKIEDDPERAAVREKGGVLRSAGRVGMSVRFPAEVTNEGIRLHPLI